MTTTEEVSKHVQELKAQALKLDADRLEIEKTLQVQTWRREYLEGQAKALTFPAMTDDKAKAELEKVRAELEQTGAIEAVSLLDLGHVNNKAGSLAEAIKAAEFALLEAEQAEAEKAVCVAWCEVLELRLKLQPLQDKIDALLVTEREKANALRAAGGRCNGFALPTGSDALKLETLKTRIAELS